METITLLHRDQHRLAVLTHWIGGRIDKAQAAQLLGCVERTARRLRARFVAEGAAGLLHGNRGRSPANKTQSSVVVVVKQLAGPEGPYADLNTCHLAQLLQEREGLSLARSTLDRLLKEQGIRKPRRQRKRRVFTRRERMPAEGMLLLLDGSLHPWLEKRGPKLCLVGSVDDATSTFVYAHFHPSESQEAYLRMARAIAAQKGLPMAVYHDKHTILRSPKEATLEEQLSGREPMSQVQRLFADLGIESIVAHSPQAKGRIERAWATFQDRLVKEMRLAGITTREEANAFLPTFLLRYNAQFAVEPADPTPAWVPLEAGTDLDYYFSLVETRTVKDDHTLSFNGKTLQIVAASRTRSLAGQKVTVRINPEGEMALYDGKKRLQYRPVPASQSNPKPPLPLPENPKKQPAEHGLTKRQRDWLHASI